MLDIRRATRDDCEEIGRVHVRSIREICGGHYAPESIEAWASPRKGEHYLKAIRDKEFYVAEEDGAVVGFGNLNAETCEIEAVYVSPEASGRGVGMNILRTLEGRARELGLKSLVLNASLNAVAFYERGGFASERAGTHTLANGAVIPCVLMSKRLAV